MAFRVEVAVMFKEGLLDPQSNTVSDAMRRMEYKFKSLRVVKYFAYQTSAKSEQGAREEVNEIFRDPALNFSNFNIESYRILSLTRVE